MKPMFALYTLQLRTFNENSLFFNNDRPLTLINVVPYVSIYPDCNRLVENFKYGNL